MDAYRTLAPQARWHSFPLVIPSRGPRRRRRSYTERRANHFEIVWRVAMLGMIGGALAAVTFD
jgi:hypothetical protein